MCVSGARSGTRRRSSREQALSDVRAGRLDPRIWGTMAQIARAMVSVIQAGEVEQRLRDLEDRTRSMPDQSDRRFP